VDSSPTDFRIGEASVESHSVPTLRITYLDFADNTSAPETTVTYPPQSWSSNYLYIPQPMYPHSMGTAAPPVGSISSFTTSDTG